MHATSSFLFLCFLFASFLSVANAYPRPQGLAVRAASPDTGVPQRVASQRAKTSQTNRNKIKTETEEEKLRKEKERKDKERKEKEELQRQKNENKKGRKNDKKGKKKDPGGPGKDCDVPVPQQFKDGPECKEIAEAFNSCGRSLQASCKPKDQKKCLCDQAGKFSDTLVKRCYDFLKEQNPSASQGLDSYRDICGS
ncbi:MAG: hypothetical protein LQ339_000079 [Xanthoria mediterranea]|nr:MAG: hypothetical protein LQ339_000079 [Xanthoria mediterranea]